MNRSLIAFTLAITACSPDAPKTADDSAVPSPPPAVQTRAREWEVTPAGLGSLKAGMSLDEANIIMHNDLQIPSKLEECDFIKTKSGPKGIMIMVEKGEISRVDITSGAVATVEGARIGDTEDRIKSLYPGQVTVQPHKYTSGHYLVVAPKGGGDNRIIFETDGKRVTRYRSGRMPAVQYVEGCA